jgi:hypothetical protein
MKKRLTTLALAAVAFTAIAQAQNSFAIIVDTETYKNCCSEIEDYRKSVEERGLDAFVIENKWTCPEEIRDTLIHYYNTRSLEGTVFVGDIPIPMVRKAQHLASAFKMDENAFKMRDSSVPSDRFYDDFDLKFDFIKRDTVETSFYYYNLSPESPQTICCDIYSGRIKPSSDRGNKYEELSRYLKKVVRTKKENNFLDKVTSYTGDGSFSNSLVAWKDETVTLMEQMPQAFNTGDGAKFYAWTMYPYLKDILTAEIQRKDLDLVLFHEHGVPDRQYLTGTPLADDIDSFYEFGTLNARNQYRRLLRRGRSREDAIVQMQESYGVDTSWFVNALDPEVVKADSIADMKTGIVLDDLARIKPNVKVALFDACYNGDFRETDFIANRYIMSEGDAIVCLANSVNVLQDKSSCDLMGMLSCGYNVGQWQQQIHILESHVIGDPTFAFSPSVSIAMPDLQNTSVKYWKKYISDKYPCDIQGLALHKLFHLGYKNMSDLLLDTYKSSDYYMVRLQCMHLLAHYYDENYITLLKYALDDPYEFIRRKGAYFASKVGREDLATDLAKMYLEEYNAKRVAFNIGFSAGHFPDDVFMTEFNKVLDDASFIFNKEQYAADASKAFKSSIGIRNMTAKYIGDKSQQTSNRYSYIGGMRNMPYAHLADALIDVTKDSDEEEKLRVRCAEVLGWYVRAYNRSKIVENLESYLNSGAKMPDAVRDEIIKTNNRLKAYMR